MLDFWEKAIHDPGAFATLLGALFALVSVVLLYLTLRWQSQTSQEQSFETKYFALIRMHRDNVAELELPGAIGRKIFVLLFRELRCALEIVRQVVKGLPQQLTQREMLHIAYYCLFFGVGPNSSRMLRTSLGQFDQELIGRIENALDNDETKQKIKNARGFCYIPFEGHQSRLGHYYRHLYQMVRYVDQQTLAINKYEYVKTIRAQLSTHEQALLLVNCLTPLGRNWLRLGFIRNYRLVQNIPRDFFNSANELDLGGLFDPGYFEWEETVAGVNQATGQTPVS